MGARAARPARGSRLTTWEGPQAKPPASALPNWAVWTPGVQSLGGSRRANPTAKHAEAQCCLREVSLRAARGLCAQTGGKHRATSFEPENKGSNPCSQRAVWHKHRNLCLFAGRRSAGPDLCPPVPLLRASVFRYQGCVFFLFVITVLLARPPSLLYVFLPELCFP